MKRIIFKTIISICMLCNTLTATNFVSENKDNNALKRLKRLNITNITKKESVLVEALDTPYMTEFESDGIFLGATLGYTSNSYEITSDQCIYYCWTDTYGTKKTPVFGVTFGYKHFSNYLGA